MKNINLSFLENIELTPEREEELNKFFIEYDNAIKKRLQKKFNKQLKESLFIFYKKAKNKINKLLEENKKLKNLTEKKINDIVDNLTDLTENEIKNLELINSNSKSQILDKIIELVKPLTNTDNSADLLEDINNIINNNNNNLLKENKMKKNTIKPKGRKLKAYNVFKIKKAKKRALSLIKENKNLTKLQKTLCKNKILLASTPKELLEAKQFIVSTILENKINKLKLLEKKRKKREKIKSLAKTNFIKDNLKKQKIKEALSVLTKRKIKALVERKKCLQEAKKIKKQALIEEVKKEKQNILNENMQTNGFIKPILVENNSTYDDELKQILINNLKPFIKNNY